MNAQKYGRICPVEFAGHLDSRFRRWLQDPRKILKPYLKPGMRTLDVGCGPGVFSVEMAELVGDGGHVVAADLQPGMLQIVKNKISGTTLEKRITLHPCEEDHIGIDAFDPVDFILLFYVVHEMPNQATLFHELAKCLKPGGQILITEPSFHVSKSLFETTITIARRAGFKAVQRPKIRLSKSILMQAE